MPTEFLKLFGQKQMTALFPYNCTQRKVDNLSAKWPPPFSSNAHYVQLLKFFYFPKIFYYNGIMANVNFWRCVLCNCLQILELCSSPFNLLTSVRKLVLKILLDFLLKHVPFFVLVCACEQMSSLKWGYKMLFNKLTFVSTIIIIEGVCRRQQNNYIFFRFSIINYILDCFFCLIFTVQQEKWKNNWYTKKVWRVIIQMSPWALIPVLPVKL